VKLVSTRFDFACNIHTKIPYFDSKIQISLRNKEDQDNAFYGFKSQRDCYTVIRFLRRFLIDVKNEISVDLRGTRFDREKPGCRDSLTLRGIFSWR
jgi:hypothetical protein